MKAYQKVFFGLGILLLIGLHRYLFATKEGFLDDSSDYSSLQKRLSVTMAPYCKISSFVRDQLKIMIAATGASVDIESTYKEVYSCSDKLASSRPSCVTPNMSMSYVGCDTYMKLPRWSSDGSSTQALMNITNDLPERLVREAEWFAAIIKQLNDSLALGANPPTSMPAGYEMSEIKLKEPKKEGFAVCSPEAAEYQRSQKLRKEAASCSIPSASSEIQRVNSLLDSPDLKNALGRMDGLLSAMLKIQSDLEKAKNGTLYPWQKDGPKKEFPQFQGGDRTASLLFSMRQNQM
jgi:hypothetical protein